MTDTLPAALASFAESPAGQAIAVLLVLAVADLLVGTFAAIRDGVFQLDRTSAWVRSNLSKLIIVTTALVAGHVLGDLTIAGLGELPGFAFTAAGLAGAASYALAVIGSLRESLIAKPAPPADPNPPGEVREVPPA